MQPKTKLIDGVRTDILTGEPTSLSARRDVGLSGNLYDKTVEASALTTPVSKVTVPEPTQATVSPYTSQLVSNISRDTSGFISAQSDEAKQLREVQQAYSDLNNQQSLTDYYNATLESYGVTPESFKELKDINLQLTDMQTASDLIKTQIAGAEGQTFNQGTREVTQEDRENAVRSSGLAARAAVLQGNIETAQAAATQAANLAYQDRTLEANNLINQITSLQGQVDQQTAQLLEQEKRQYEQDLAKIQEVKDAISNAVVAGATQSEITQLTSSTVSDEEKLALSNEIQARNARQQINLQNSLISAQISNYNSQIDERNSNPTVGYGVSQDQINQTLSGEFGDVINSAANLVGSERGKTSRQSIAAAIAGGDYTSAYAQVANNVEESLTGEAKSRFANQRTDYLVLSGLQEALQQFEDAGGETGILTGKVEEINRKLLGYSNNPELSALATQLDREFQAYRQAMTGAAFGPGESADYEKVNPSGKKTFELNSAIIEGAQNQIENRITSTINSRIPNANKLYSKVTGQGVSPEMAQVGDIIEIGGIRYQKVGEDQYIEI